MTDLTLHASRSLQLSVLLLSRGLELVWACLRADCLIARLKAFAVRLHLRLEGSDETRKPQTSLCASMCRLATVKRFLPLLMMTVTVELYRPALGCYSNPKLNPVWAFNLHSCCNKTKTIFSYCCFNHYAHLAEGEDEVRPQWHLKFEIFI